MTHPIRFFTDDAAVRHVGEGLLACTLPRGEWTHEAHLAATVWLLVERPDIDLDTEIGGIISRYNASVGGVNDDHNGYHDTITRTYLAGSRAFLRGHPGGGLAERVNALLASDTGGRDWPLNFYSRELLFSVTARRAIVDPNIRPLPSSCLDDS